MENQPTFVEYARAMPRRELPSPVSAMILCVPGLICWCVLLGMWLVPASARANFRFLDVFPPGTILWCWIIAIACAFISLAIYGRGPKPWYVWINFAINISGLLFSLGVVVLIMMASHGD